jgi:hypothetical protein
MPATPFAALGTQIWIGDGGSPENFWKVARVQDISGPDNKTDTIDVTTHDDAILAGGDNFKQFIASLQDGQTITFPIVFDPNEVSHAMAPTVPGTTCGGLAYLQQTRARRNGRMAFPMVSPAARLRMQMLVIGYKYDAKMMGALSNSITIKVSGAPILEAGVGGPT